jgi:hypothetical protein
MAAHITRNSRSPPVCAGSPEKFEQSGAPTREPRHSEQQYVVLAAHGCSTYNFLRFFFFFEFWSIQHAN